MKKIKVIVIEDCEHCPNMEKRPSTEPDLCCAGEEEYQLPMNSKIPQWCPLATLEIETRYILHESKTRQP